jgi:SAM-dependent methyltransferase
MPSTTTSARTSGDDGDGAYALDRTPEEYERLRIQARVWEPATTRVLDAIGVSPGMRGLDVGCGPGEGLRLLAERVGPAGSVTGIDNDPAVARDAAAHVRATTDTPVEVVTADVRDLADPPGGPFDVVTVRLVLMHLPDPVAVLRRLRGWLRPGGVLLVQDYDIGPYAMWPPVPQWAELVRTVEETVDAIGGDVRCGRKLPLHLAAAGLGEPAGVDVSSVLAPVVEVLDVCVSAYGNLLPAAVRLGTTTEERGREVLAEMAAVAGDGDRVVMLPQLVSCWARTPA